MWGHTMGVVGRSARVEGLPVWLASGAMSSSAPAGPEGDGEPRRLAPCEGEDCAGGGGACTPRPGWIRVAEGGLPLCVERAWLAMRLGPWRQIGWALVVHPVVPFAINLLSQIQVYRAGRGRSE